MGHAAAALYNELRVRSITLLIIGGMTEINQENTTAKQALGTAVAGPAVNLGLGFFCMMVAKWMPPSAVDLRLIFFVTGIMNLFLAIFNMLPAYPLDGGRALKAVLELRMSPMGASEATCTVGRIIAIILSILGFTHGDPFLVIISFFLYFGAESDRTRTKVQLALAGLRAEQAMTIRVVSVGPERPITSVAREMLMHDAAAAMVRDVRRTYGVVLPDQLLGRTTDTVNSLVDGEPIVIRFDDPLDEVAHKIQWSQKPAIVLDRYNTPVGVVTNGEIMRAARLRILADQGLETSSQTIEAKDRSF